MSRPFFYLGSDKGLTQLRDGQPFLVDTDDEGITSWTLLEGVWETFVDDILQAVTKPGNTFVDIGANMGRCTVKAGTAVGPMRRVVFARDVPEYIYDDAFIVQNHPETGRPFPIIRHRGISMPLGEGGYRRGAEAER